MDPLLQNELQSKSAIDPNFHKYLVDRVRAVIDSSGLKDNDPLIEATAREALDEYFQDGSQAIKSRPTALQSKPMSGESNAFSIAGAALWGFADSATFGLGTGLAKKLGLDPDFIDTTEEKLASGIGSVAGFLVPYGAPAKFAKLAVGARAAGKAERGILRFFGKTPTVSRRGHGIAMGLDKEAGTLAKKTMKAVGIKAEGSLFNEVSADLGVAASGILRGSDSIKLFKWQGKNLTKSMKDLGVGSKAFIEKASKNILDDAASASTGRISQAFERHLGRKLTAEEGAHVMKIIETGLKKGSINSVEQMITNKWGRFVARQVRNALETSLEFGAFNLAHTVVHGVAHNDWSEEGVRQLVHDVPESVKHGLQAGALIGGVVKMVPNLWWGSKHGAINDIIDAYGLKRNRSIQGVNMHQKTAEGLRKVNNIMLNDVYQLSAGSVNKMLGTKISMDTIGKTGSLGKTLRKLRGWSKKKNLTETERNEINDLARTNGEFLLRGGEIAERSDMRLAGEELISLAKRGDTKQILKDLNPVFKQAAKEWQGEMWKDLAKHGVAMAPRVLSSAVITEPEFFGSLLSGEGGSYLTKHGLDWVDMATSLTFATMMASHSAFETPVAARPITDSRYKGYMQARAMLAGVPISRPDDSPFATISMDVAFRKYQDLTEKFWESEGVKKRLGPLRESVLKALETAPEGAIPEGEFGKNVTHWLRRLNIDSKNLSPGKIAAVQALFEEHIPLGVGGKGPGYLELETFDRIYFGEELHKLGRKYLEVEGDLLGTVMQADEQSASAMAKSKIVEQAVKAFPDVPEAQVRSAVDLLEARANAWGVAEGKDPAEWYASRLASVEKGEGEKKASITFMEDGRAVIRGLNAPNLQSLVHEIGHLFRRDLGGEHLAIIESEFGIKDGKWQKKHEERFAKLFERYLESGKAPNDSMKTVFQRLSGWLKSIFSTMKKNDTLPAMSEGVEKAIHSLFGTGKIPVSAKTGLLKNKRPLRIEVEGDVSTPAELELFAKAERTGQSLFPGVVHEVLTVDSPQQSRELAERLGAIDKGVGDHLGGGRGLESLSALRDFAYFAPHTRVHGIMSGETLFQGDTPELEEVRGLVQDIHKMWGDGPALAPTGDSPAERIMAMVAKTESVTKGRAVKEVTLTLAQSNVLEANYAKVGEKGINLLNIAEQTGVVTGKNLALLAGGDVTNAAHRLVNSLEIIGAAEPGGQLKVDIGPAVESVIGATGAFWLRDMVKEMKKVGILRDPMKGVDGVPPEDTLNVLKAIVLGGNSEARYDASQRLSSIMLSEGHLPESVARIGNALNHVNPAYASYIYTSLSGMGIISPEMSLMTAKSTIHKDVTAKRINEAMDAIEGEFMANEVLRADIESRFMNEDGRKVFQIKENQGFEITGHRDFISNLGLDPRIERVAQLMTHEAMKRKVEKGQGISPEDIRSALVEGLLGGKDENGAYSFSGIRDPEWVEQAIKHVTEGGKAPEINDSVRNGRWGGSPVSEKMLNHLAHVVSQSTAGETLTITATMAENKSTGKTEYNSKIKTRVHGFISRGLGGMVDAIKKSGATVRTVDKIDVEKLKYVRDENGEWVKDGKGEMVPLDSFEPIREALETLDGLSALIIPGNADSMLAVSFDAPKAREQVQGLLNELFKVEQGGGKRLKSWMKSHQAEALLSFLNSKPGSAKWDANKISNELSMAWLGSSVDKATFENLLNPDVAGKSIADYANRLNSIYGRDFMRLDYGPGTTQWKKFRESDFGKRKLAEDAEWDGGLNVFFLENATPEIMAEMKAAGLNRAPLDGAAYLRQDAARVAAYVMGKDYSDAFKGQFFASHPDRDFFYLDKPMFRNDSYTEAFMNKLEQLTGQKIDMVSIGDSTKIKPTGVEWADVRALEGKSEAKPPLELKPFELKIGELGKGTTATVEKNLCVRCANKVQHQLMNQGLDSKVVIIDAKSPAGNFNIQHWVAVTEIAGKRYIVDHPQSEFMGTGTVEAGGEFRNAMADWHSGEITRDLRNLDTLVRAIGVELREMFTGNYGQDAIDMGGMTQGKPLFTDVVSSGHERFPTYTGKYGDYEVRLDTNSNDFEYRSLVPTKGIVVKDTQFRPRLIEATQKAMKEAYGTGSKKSLKAVMDAKIKSSEMPIAGGKKDASASVMKNALNIRELGLKEFDHKIYPLTESHVGEIFSVGNDAHEMFYRLREEGLQALYAPEGPFWKMMTGDIGPETLGSLVGGRLAEASLEDAGSIYQRNVVADILAAERISPGLFLDPTDLYDTIANRSIKRGLFKAKQRGGFGAHIFDDLSGTLQKGQVRIPYEVASRRLTENTKIYVGDKPYAANDVKLWEQVIEARGGDKEQATTLAEYFGNKKSIQEYRDKLDFELVDAIGRLEMEFGADGPNTQSLGGLLKVVDHLAKDTAWHTEEFKGIDMLGHSMPRTGPHDRKPFHAREVAESRDTKFVEMNHEDITRLERDTDGDVVYFHYDTPQKLRDHISEMSKYEINPEILTGMKEILADPAGYKDMWEYNASQREYKKRIGMVANFMRDVTALAQLGISSRDADGKYLIGGVFDGIETTKDFLDVISGKKPAKIKLPDAKEGGTREEYYGTTDSDWGGATQRKDRVYRGQSGAFKVDAEGNLILPAAKDDMFSRRFPGKGVGTSVTGDLSQAREYAITRFNGKARDAKAMRESEPETFDVSENIEGESTPTVVEIDKATFEAALKRGKVETLEGQESSVDGLAGETRTVSSAPIKIKAGKFKISKLEPGGKDFEAAVDGEILPVKAGSYSSTGKEVDHWLTTKVEMPDGTKKELSLLEYMFLNSKAYTDGKKMKLKPAWHGAKGEVTPGWYKTLWEMVLPAHGLKTGEKDAGEAASTAIQATRKDFSRGLGDINRVIQPDRANAKEVGIVAKIEAFNTLKNIVDGGSNLDMKRPLSFGADAKGRLTVNNGTLTHKMVATAGSLFSDLYSMNPANIDSYFSVITSGLPEIRRMEKEGLPSEVIDNYRKELVTRAEETSLTPKITGGMHRVYTQELFSRYLANDHISNASSIVPEKTKENKDSIKVLERVEETLWDNVSKNSMMVNDLGTMLRGYTNNGVMRTTSRNLAENHQFSHITPTKVGKAWEFKGLTQVDLQYGIAKAIDRLYNPEAYIGKLHSEKARGAIHTALGTRRGVTIPNATSYDTIMHILLQLHNGAVGPLGKQGKAGRWGKVPRLVHNGTKWVGVAMPMRSPDAAIYEPRGAKAAAVKIGKMMQANVGKDLKGLELKDTAIFYTADGRVKYVSKSALRAIAPENSPLRAIANTAYDGQVYYAEDYNVPAFNKMLTQSTLDTNYRSDRLFRLDLEIQSAELRKELERGLQRPNRKVSQAVIIEDTGAQPAETFYHSGEISNKKLVKLHESERKLAEEILDHPILGGVIKDMYFDHGARVEEAMKMISDIGGYTAGLDVPTWKNLRDARYNLEKSLGRMGKGGVNLFLEKTLLPRSFVNRVPILKRWYKDWIRASAQKRNAAKVVADVQKHIYDIFDGILNTKGNIFQRPKIAIRGLSAMAQHTKHKKLVAEHADLERAAHTIEYDTEMDHIPVNQRNQVMSQVEGKVLPHDAPNRVRTAYKQLQKGQNPEIPASRDVWNRYLKLRERITELEEVITSAEAGGVAAVALDTFLGRLSGSGSVVRDELFGRDKKARLRALKRLGIDASPVHHRLPKHSRVIFVDRDGESIYSGQLLGEASKDTYRISVSRKDGDRPEIIVVDKDLVDVAHGKAREMQGTIDEAIAREAKVERAQTIKEITDTFGADTASKLEKLSVEVAEMHEKLWPIVQDSHAHNVAYTRYRLRHVGVSEKEITEFIEKYMPQLRASNISVGYMHRVRPGAVYTSSLAKEAWRDKTLVGDVTGRLSDFERLMGQWTAKQEHIFARDRSLKKPPTFLEYADKYYEEYGQYQGTPYIAPPMGAIRSRVGVPRSMEGEFSWRFSPSATMSIETYGAQVQSAAYVSRMNHNYERVLNWVHNSKRVLNGHVGGEFAKRKEWLKAVTTIGEFFERHRRDSLFHSLDEKGERRRHIANAILAWQAFAKIGYNLKTIVQNSTQALMHGTKVGWSAMMAGKAWMETEEGKRILHSEALDWDPSTAPYLLHKEDSIFDGLFQGVRPRHWTEKLIKSMDTFVDKSQALRMLAMSEMSLHKWAFSTAFSQARSSIGENEEIRSAFEHLPETVAARELAASRNGEQFDRFAYLQRFGVHERELDLWHGETGGSPGSLEPADRYWKKKYQGFLEKKAIDIAHDARIFINGDYSTAGRPEWFRTNWGRFIFQFRLFDVIFGTYMAESGNELARRTKDEYKAFKATRKMTPEQKTEYREEAGLSGDSQHFAGQGVVPEAAWMIRLGALIPFLQVVSGVLNADMGGWFEPTAISIVQGMADFVSDDEEKRKRAFYKRPVASQLSGPAISDMMDIMAWMGFHKLQNDSRLSQFFFGSKIWADTPLEEKERKLAEKFSSAGSRYAFRTLPMIARGQQAEALKQMLISPDYAGMKKVQGLRDAKDKKEVAKLLFGLANPLN